MAKRTHPLRAFRLQKKLSCEDLGKKLNIAATTVRSYENGNRTISGDFALTIEEKLGIPREQIRPDLFQRVPA